MCGERQNCGILGDSPNRHDILTGSSLEGTIVDAEGDTTCDNWTSSGEGSAMVGHHDRTGGGANPTSWNSAHASRGCSQENLQGTGGDGLFYCFAVDAAGGTPFEGQEVGGLRSGRSGREGARERFPVKDHVESPGQRVEVGLGGDRMRERQLPSGRA